mmetsp:Transcript_8541/g.16336  ORF Transcript_8541/g.16336 Transcript_8541/m.16336 type:complete len:202 (+) Transcript_8541:628-1233(+)
MTSFNNACTLSIRFQPVMVSPKYVQSSPDTRLVKLSGPIVLARGIVISGRMETSASKKTDPVVMDLIISRYATRARSRLLVCIPGTFSVMVSNQSYRFFSRSMIWSGGPTKRSVEPSPVAAAGRIMLKISKPSPLARTCFFFSYFMVAPTVSSNDAVRKYDSSKKKLLEKNDTFSMDVRPVPNTRPKRKCRMSGMVVWMVS